MGEYAPNAPSIEQEEVNVLVTGFDIFLDHGANASWLIAKSLSSQLLPPKPGGVKINVHVRQVPVKVAYDYVREQIPPLLFTSDDAIGEKSSGGSTGAHAESESVGEGRHIEQSEKPQKPLDEVPPKLEKRQKPAFDMVLLMGMAAGKHYYTMETRAHRDGYSMPDVDGKRIVGDKYWQDLGAPEILETGLNHEDVWRRWKDECMDEDVRPSTDAGRYLCDFSFYTSLVTYWQHEVRAPLTFLHVPGETEKEDLEKGKKVAHGLLRAMADSETKSTG